MRDEPFRGKSADHTPGPWHVDDDGFTVRDGNDDFVAEARSFAYTDDGEEDLPTNGPNARLIAEAPAMYDALKNFFDRDVAYSDRAVEITCENHGDGMRRVREARAILARIDGAS